MEQHFEFARTTCRTILDPALILSEQALVLYANEAAQARWPEGCTVEATSSFGAAVLPRLRAGEPSRAEWGEDGPAGVRSWYACTIAPLGDGSRALGWLCISTDVTGLKRSEERLRRSEQLMVDTQGVAHLGTWDWDLSKPNAHWSDELYRIYGLTADGYTPSYEGYLKMVHPDDRQRVMDATNRVFHEHVPYSHDERIFRPDGSMRYLHTWAYPILDEQGKLQSLVGVCQDITDRAEAEEKVLRLNAELEKRVTERTRQLETSMRDLEAFNAMVSHDLRAPLSTIELASTLISRIGATPEDIARGRERIKRGIGQMKTLIDDLLAFAKIDNVALSRVAVDVSALVQEIVSELRQANPERTVELMVDAHIACFADRTLMRLALQNLIGNAWKYTTHVASARVEITKTVVDGRQILQIRDNGAGFDMKDAHRLFAPFQRLHSDREFSGTGVGLASVHRILERHGSRVWAEGSPGKGATFFVELPDEAQPDVPNARVSPTG